MKTAEQILEMSALDLRKLVALQQIHLAKAEQDFTGGDGPHAAVIADKAVRAARKVSEQIQAVFRDRKGDELEPCSTCGAGVVFQSWFSDTLALRIACIEMLGEDKANARIEKALVRKSQP